MKNFYYQFKKRKRCNPLFFFLFLFILSSNIAWTQLNLGGTPKSFNQSLKKEVAVTVMPSIDLDKIKAEDEINDLRKIPYRIAVPMQVSYNLKNSGTWEDLANGDRVWRFTINCPKALGTTLLYDDFFMPKGARLYLYNDDRSHVLGAFTALNNKPIRQFATAILNGNSVTIEYYEPALVKGLGAISISQVGHVYRGDDGMVENNAQLGNSGSCQVDVNCSPEGDSWQNEKKGVAKILINGSGLCTGSLINNVEQDCRPLFLTADHCLGNVDAIANPNAPGWVFYWNFERTGCANITDPVDDAQTTSGAVLLANAGQEINNDPASLASDFALFELSENPSDSYDVFYPGFDASGATGTGGAGIHHPGGDAKKIATHNLTPTSVVNNNYWRILPWSATANGQSVTEGGSSGSPLFNNTGLIIGQLFGGFAGGQPNCSDPSADEGDYGRLDVSWNFGATATRRLRDHLDPMGTGSLIVPGRDGSACGSCMLVVDCSQLADQNLSCRTDLPPVDFDLVNATDSCGNVTKSALTIIPGNAGCPGNPLLITREYFLNDGTTSASCMQTFTIVSMTAPTISCPTGGMVECAADIPPISTANAVVTNECSTADVMVSGPVINGDPDCPGTTYTYTYTATDHCDRMVSCDQVFTIQNDAPTIVCPANMMVECLADIVPNNSLPVVTTSCAIGTVTFVGPTLISGAQDCPGTKYSVVYTVNDNCGRSAECTQIFTIQNDGPIVTCPAPEIVECGEDIVVNPSDVSVTVSCGLTFTTEVFGPNVYDGLPNCPGSRYVYRYLVTDECGRQSVCLREFFIENDAPTITCMPNQVVTCEDDIITDPAQMITFTTSCDLEADIDVNGPNLVGGAPSCNGTQYDVTYTVTDRCGRSESCTIRWTLSNSGPSIVVCAPDRIVECNADIASEPELLEVELECGSYQIFPSNIFSINGLGNCPGAQYGITYQVFDVCGRSATCTQIWTLENDPPRVIPPDPIQVACLDDVNPNIFDAEAETSCGLAIVDREIFGPLYDEEEPLCTGSVVNYLYSFWDECGRMTCEAQIVIIDIGAGANTTFDDLVVECDDLPVTENSVSICGVDYDLTVEDDIVPSPGSSDDYKVIRTYLGEDECGNTFTIEQIINVKCDGAPQPGSSRMCMLSDEGWADTEFVMEDPMYRTINVSKDNPLVIGFGGRKLVINDYACIAELLPIQGKPRIFPYDMNTVDLHLENGCTGEFSESVRKAIFENSLLSQIIALHLNFQVNPESAALDFSNTCFNIDPKIKQELGGNVTMASLFELAENALAGYYEGNVYRLEKTLKEALEYFSDCPEYPCENGGALRNSIAGFDGENRLEVYPNPAIDYLNVVVRNVKEESILNIFSAFGDLVYEKTVMTDIFEEISVDHLPEGIYHMVLRKENRVVQTQKFIKVSME